MTYPDLAAAIRYAGESSLTTHGAPECVDAYRLLAGMIFRALSGSSKEKILMKVIRSAENRRSL
jgi:ADP-ribosyl-[dinitrogen reductase] hydrolase